MEGINEMSKKYYNQSYDSMTYFVSSHRAAVKARVYVLKRRLKIKIKAFFAFRERLSRGHILNSLRLEGCDLRSLSNALFSYL